MADLPDIGICYPDGADWGCEFTPADLEEMIADPPTALNMARSEALAWATLSQLTAGAIATCPVTVRPCLEGCNGQGSWVTAPLSSGRFSPYISQGSWYNACGCTSDCSCTALCEVILPGQVGGISEVWVDGAVLSPTAYRVDNGNRLVRTDAGCWPPCQDMQQGSHGEDAFSVTYYNGAPPNLYVKWAAGILAVEFYKACIGGPCRLPTGVTSVSRQGISFEIQTGLFASGFTGIQEVDTVIGLYNPYGLKSAPVVSSPDRRRARTTTWGN